MSAKNKKTIQLAVLIAVGFNVWMWYGILSGGATENAAYFLDVGQGDSQLITLASGRGEPPVNILIDGGRDRKILDALDAALGADNNKYIDIVIITHPHLDHFGGMVEVLKRYDVGLFISNGQQDDSTAFHALKERLAERGVRALILREGDAVRYRASVMRIISPDRALLDGGDVDDASLVILLEAGASRALFVGDLRVPAEQVLLKKGYDLNADVLKVGHHGSKYSSSENFIAAVRPLIAAIGVGQNRYGHPAPQTLTTLELVGARVHRTDRGGTLKVVLDKGFAARADTGFADFLAAAAKLLTNGRASRGIAVLSLSELAGEEKESLLVPYTKCSFSSGSNSSPARTPVIINEVAWMGSEKSSGHEWLELKNVSGGAVTMSGWQLLNENEKLRITFPQQMVFNKGFMVLARSAANEALRLDADLAVSAALRNRNEGLRLFDNTCRLIDEVLAAPAWPAGNNSSKQTMQRAGDFTWANSFYVGGTPGAE